MENKQYKFEESVFSKIDKSWTLFLDRDGVINKKLENDYVKNLDELEFLPGALDAIKYFNSIFHKVVVVTNQQGIGKGIMTEEDLKIVHQKISEKLSAIGGRIDQFYHAPQLAIENAMDRKPNIGMALKAQKEFPSIEFSKSIIIGDSISDMEFGVNAGMYPIYLSTKKSTSTAYYTMNSLESIALKLKEKLTD